MSENNENDLMVLPCPPSLLLEFRTLDGYVLGDLNALRDLLDSYCADGEAQRAFWNRTNQVATDLADRYVDDFDRSIGIVGRTKWRVNFYDLYAQGGKQNLGVFVAFTGILDVVLDKEKQAELSSFIIRTAAEHEHEDPPLLIEGFHNGIVYVFGFMIDTQRTLITKAEVPFRNLEQVGIDHFCHWKHLWPTWAEYTLQAFPLNDQNKEPEVSEQQATPAAEQESDGTKPTVYYGRHDLSMLLQETADPSDLINVEKFIDDQLSAWSKHLALNTHKKQTDKTPRFSIHEGPGIITILLDRSDLEFGERAPQLQMIFTDGESGISITPRQQGGMTTSRMLDAFDQILLELNSGKRVPFCVVDSLVTFVDHVADHTDSLAFREAVGDPKQALVLSGIENPHVTFYMHRSHRNTAKIIVEAHFDREDGSEAGILFTVLLDDVGHQGNLMVKVAADSPKQPPLAKNVERFEEASKEGPHVKQLSETWKEVRDTPADPDSVLEKLPAPRKLNEAVVEATKMRDFYLTGSDQAMLKHVLARFRNEGNLNNLDSFALDAAESFIFAGGLVNAGDWHYEACLTSERDEQELAFLRGENNAYIIVLNKDSNVPILTFQCQVSDAQQQ
jgi:hypothetical protein